MRLRNAITSDAIAEPARGTWRAWRWRGLYFVGLAAAVGSLVTGLALASLPATGTGTGSASTGSVNLTTTATQTCNYSSLSPGDLSGSTACALSVTYTGSISAYVSLTVAIQSKAGPGVGAHSLYDGSNTNGLTFAISDNGGKSFTVPTGAGTTGGSCPAGFTCWAAANDLAAWYSPANLTFTNGNTATWTVTPKFPKTVTNAYQGAAATLILTAQAVQAPVNPLPAGCTTSTIGQSCPASGSFTWS